MKLLVTGAAGMLATELVPALQRAGHDVHGIDRAEVDITVPGALETLARDVRPDWIAHLAAYTKVDDCEAHADDAYAVNALGSRHAALASLACGAALLAISTDYVFGGRGSTPYREYDAADPKSVYGASKWAGEQAIRELQPRHTIVRTSWLFGAGGPNFIDTVVRKAAAGEPLRVVDDQRGSPTWTRDLSATLVRLIEAEGYGTFHSCNSGECTWHELAEYAVGRAGHPVAIERMSTAALGRPAPRPAYSVLNTQLADRVTGRRMPHWHEAVDRYLESRVPVA